MWSSLVEYHRPTTADYCVRLLSRTHPYTVPLAGGTWLVAQCDPGIEAVVDLSALKLAFIKYSARRIRLGAMTTLQALINSPSIQNIANGLLRDAAYNCAPRAIRNVATLGGTIMVGNSFSEVRLALLVLDAQVVVHTPKAQVIPLQEFFDNQVANLPHASIITEIIIPRSKARVGSYYSKVSRTPYDQPIVNAAALVSRVGHVCRLGRLALGGVSDYPIRLPEIEGMIFYKSINTVVCDQVSEAVQGALKNFSLTEYKREMAGIVVARTLQEAWDRSGKE